MENKKKQIFVCAYSFYPEQSSSEAIVNRNWVDVLSGVVMVKVLSSHQSCSKTGDLVRSAFLSNVYGWGKHNKNSFPAMVLRIFNKVVYNSPNIYHRIWEFYQHRAIVRIQNTNQGVLFWARVLPAASISPVLSAYKRNRFPYVVNINDPIHLPEWNAETQRYQSSFLKNSNSIDNSLILQTRDSAQCWTFPSLGLARFMAGNYGLDMARCFVLPHAMPSRKSLFREEREFGKKVEFVYTGTFYKSAFSSSFLQQLKEFSQTTHYSQCRFTFVLAQYDESSIEWLNEALPEVTIYKKVTREQAIAISERADCILVTDAANHRDLLKGKLVEAISLGVPVFAVSYSGSLMTTLVKEYGGFVGLQDNPGDIKRALENAVAQLIQTTWRKAFITEREMVRLKLSEQIIAEKSIQIANYALDRFEWYVNKSQQGLPPALPDNLQWP